MTVGTMARIRTVFTGVGGTPAYSNFYFDADETSARDYFEPVVDFWTTMKPHYFLGVTAQVQGDIAIVNSADGAIVGSSSGVSASITGTATGDLLPTSSSGLLRMKTGVYVNSREVRGRCFVPYPVEPDNGPGGGVSSGYVTTLLAAGGTLQGITGSNGAWVVWSRKNGQFFQVASVDVWGIWAVMRSRRD